MIEDPLKHFYKKIGYSASQIKQFIIGEKYAIVELGNGACGVCGKNNEALSANISQQINFDNFHDRLLYNCYVNAKLNCNWLHLSPSSFVETLKVEEYKNIVMIGLFRPLLERYHKKKVYPAVFDMNKNEPGLTPMNKQNELLRNADLVIISATTIANNTFTGIINHCPPQSLKVLTGPSSILHHDMFCFLPNGVISGMVFAPNKQGLIEVIKKGHGTKHFKKFGKKVDLNGN